jgi:hypothetical protein
MKAAGFFIRHFTTNTVVTGDGWKQLAQAGLVLSSDRIDKTLPPDEPGSLSI